MGVHPCAVGDKRVYVNTHELVNEVSDDKRFPKKISKGLEEVRNGVGDGLFTVRQPRQPLLLICLNSWFKLGYRTGRGKLVSRSPYSDASLQCCIHERHVR